MSHDKKTTICAHVHYTDDSSKDLRVKIIKKMPFNKYFCNVTFPTNPKNSYISICKDRIVVKKFDIPTKCAHPGCVCTELSAELVI